MDNNNNRITYASYLVRIFLPVDYFSSKTIQNHHQSQK